MVESIVRLFYDIGTPLFAVLASVVEPLCMQSTPICRLTRQQYDKSKQTEPTLPDVAIVYLEAWNIM